MQVTQVAFEITRWAKFVHDLALNNFNIVSRSIAIEYTIS